MKFFELDKISFRVKDENGLLYLTAKRDDDPDHDAAIQVSPMVIDEILKPLSMALYVYKHKKDDETMEQAQMRISDDYMREQSA